MDFFQSPIRLETPSGDSVARITISCDDSGVTVKLEHNGVEYRATGTDYFWIDALAKLQKELPQGIMLKCCLSCRHGNQCPVGNAPNEVFCTCEVPVSKIEDLFFYTEDHAERQKRSHKYTDFCQRFAFQKEDFLTYNDWKYC